jgi:isopenicillin N synthase-like dioxygenase
LLHASQSHNVPAPLSFRSEIPTQADIIYPGTKSNIAPHEADISHAATTTGIASFTSLGISAPFNAIKVLFNRLAAEPHLAARINGTYPKCGVYKAAGLHKPDVDQKITVDLSAIRLERLNRLSPELAHELGAELKEAVGFFKRIEEELVPRIMRATSAAAGFNMAALHTQRNDNHRMIDYFAKSTAIGAPRCGVHRDYGTFSINLHGFHSRTPAPSLTLFLHSQNGASGGLEYLQPGSTQWTSIPKSDGAIVWGWSSAILSGDRIQAAQHRVQATQPDSRRQTAVLFVAPDLDTVLTPRSGSATGFSDAMANGQVALLKYVLMAMFDP